jgi:hypothetical protein
MSTTPNEPGVSCHYETKPKPDEQQRTPVPCQQDRMLCRNNSTVDVKKISVNPIRAEIIPL